MYNPLLDRARSLVLADSPSAGTIVDDFDGVMHDQGHGWQNGAVYGAPIPGAVEELQLRVAGGWKTALNALPYNRAEVLTAGGRG
ncbi:hypothetical protein ACFC58_06745 [Kitasatospora purpeofusca]|uniref:hypothetical protein n=1 Tax=Kitasatospora purpeofusca TaxID=67352 RepID=UPI0035E2F70A